MKPLHCLVCNDIVAQVPKPNRLRTCYCGRHSTWSVDQGGHVIAIYDRKGRRDEAVALRIANNLLGKHGETDAAAVRALIAEINGPLKAANSLIVRAEIGKHPDIIWADSLPAAPTLSDAIMGRRQLLGRMFASLWG